MIVYLDDIMIFSQILEEYHKTVYRVLEVLAKHKLFLYLENYEFVLNTIHILLSEILKEHLRSPELSDLHYPKI